MARDNLPTVAERGEWMVVIPLQEGTDVFAWAGSEASWSGTPLAAVRM